jgi:hypothetical protein
MTNNKQKQKIKTAFGIGSHYSVTTGSSAPAFADNEISLHAAVEGIRSGDGIHIKVKTFTINIHIYQTVSLDPMIIYPVVVQTAGIFSDSSAIDAEVVDEILDPQIDDVFGYQILQRRITKRVRNGTAVQQGLEIRLQLPTNIVQLLNKETETERLQNLYFGIIGYRYDPTDTATIQVSYEIDYIEERKSITIR